MRHIRLLLSVLLLALFAGGSVYAEKIPQSRALQVASNFFKNSGHFQQNMVVLKTSEDLPGIATKGSSGDPRFYIIGNPGGKGFVIVSADSRFRQVLGYSFEHPFDAENIPENIEHWFTFLRNQMDWAEKNNITDPVAISEWRNEFKAGKPVKELSTPLWNQGTPYNNQCPMDKKERSLTGCVATAVSEVMRFHSWPVNGNGVIVGYTCSSGAKVSTRSLNHAYDWENMPYNQSDINTDAKRDAVSGLMADVGAALHLDYSASGTSGNPAQSALVNNFGYSSTIYFDFRVNYTDDEWIKMLKNEINCNRPIIYDGQDKAEGGHCFVFDGYDDKDYFHVNWGWGGKNNGYYLISALNPSKYKYNSDQEALFGFKPGDGTYKNPEHWLDLYTPGMGCKELSFTKDKSFKIEPFILTNTSVMDFTGKVALFVVDKKGNQIENLFEDDIEFPAATYTYHGWQYVNVKITKDIKKGYRIRAFYKPTGASDWSEMWRDGANPSVVQEILIAEDIEDPLEDKCSFYMTEGIATITVPSGTTTSLLNGESEVTQGVTKTETTISVDITKLTPGTKYRFHLVNGEETKDLYFTSKPIEK